MALLFWKLVRANIFLRTGDNFGSSSVASNRSDRNPSKNKILYSKAKATISVTYTTNPFITETPDQG
jgi:hypothetical protein